MNTKLNQHLKAFCLASTAVAGLLATCATASAADVTDVTESIIVTAQRRAEKLENVPITVVNISADSLQKSGAASLTDISRVVPGIRFDTRGGLMQPTIRGVGTPTNLAGAGTNVGIYVDGFYNPAPLASDFQLLNIDSIQVLKGPQGTLFGRNTSGGAIQVNTLQPSTKTKAVLQASYGSYNATKFQGYATTGLSDRVAVDFGALYSRGNGYTTNIAPTDVAAGNRSGDKVGRYENWSIRTAIKADLTDNFSVTLRYIHENKNDPTPVLLQPYVQNAHVFATAAYRAGVILPTKPNEISADEKIAIYGKTDSYQLKGDLDLDFATLTSYTMWRKDRAIQYYSLDYLNPKVLSLIYPDNNLTVSQEFILASKADSRLQYTVGAFYYDNNEVYPSVKVSIAGAPFVQSAASGANSVSYAGFADATYEVVDNLFLTGGIRYTKDQQKDAYFITFAGVRTNVPTLNSSRVTPRGVARYQLTPDSNVYASFARGYKSAIYNVGGGTLNNIYIAPEGISAWEVGYKYASRAFTANLSGYYYTYKNQQLTSIQLVNGLPQSFLRNAASSRIYGIDAELRYQLSEQFQVNAALAWNHARFRSFTNAPFFTETATHTFPVVLGNASGGHMSRAPDFTGTLGATYTTDVADGELALSGNLYYTSKFYFDTQAQVPQKGYATLGLRAEWTDPSGRYTFGVAGNNITNTHYYTVASPTTNGIGAVYGAPATFEGTLRIKLD